MTESDVDSATAGAHAHGLTDDRDDRIGRIWLGLVFGIVGGMLYSFLIEPDARAGYIVAGVCALVLVGVWLSEAQGPRR